MEQKKYTLEQSLQAYGWVLYNQPGSVAYDPRPEIIWKAARKWLILEKLLPPEFVENGVIMQTKLPAPTASAVSYIEVRDKVYEPFLRAVLSAFQSEDPRQLEILSARLFGPGGLGVKNIKFDAAPGADPEAICSEISKSLTDLENGNFEEAKDID